MLTPAEQLGLAGAALDARVRQAVNFIPDSTLVHIARRLAEDARASDVVYTHEGVVVGSSRVDLQACKLEYSIVSPK